MPRAQRWPFAGLVGGFALLAVWFGVQAGLRWHGPLAHPVWDLTADYFTLVGQGGEAGPRAISVAPERTWESLLRWLAYGATFVLVAGLSRRREDAWLLVKGCALIGLAYAAYGLVVQFGGFRTILWFDKDFYRDVVTSTFVNRNSYATFAGLTALCWTAWLLQSWPAPAPGQSRRERLLFHVQALSGPVVLLWAALLVVLTSVLLTQSRAGTTATLAGMLVMAGAHLLTRRFGGRRLLLVPAVPLLGLLAILSTDGILRRLEYHGLEDSLRQAVAATMIRATADSPWVGFGRGAFEPAFAMYRGTDLKHHFDRGHQDYVEAFFELGLPAGLLLFALCGLLAATFVHGLRVRRRDRALPALGLAAMALVGLHALFDFSLQIPGVTALFMALTAVAWSQSFRSGGT